MSNTIQCPSGLAIKAREFSVEELLQLARSFEAEEADGGLIRIMSNVTEAVIEPGPYPSLTAGGKMNWKGALKGDVMFALIQVRVASIGPKYTFRFTCESCGRQQKDFVEVDLDKCAVHQLPEATKKALAAGELLEGKTLSGRVVRFKPGMVSDDEVLMRAKRELQKQLRQKRDPRADSVLKPAQHDFLVEQTRFIEELGEEKSRNLLERMKWAASLPLSEFYHLRDMYDDADCGVDTTVKAKCMYASCGWEQEDLNLPLRGAFLVPKRKPRTTRGAKATTEEESAAILDED